MATLRTAGNSRIATVLAPSGGLTEGQPVQMGRMFGVSVNGYAEGAVAELVTEGPVEFMKDPSVVTSPGEIAYWNPDTGYVDKTRDGPTKIPIGWFMHDADLTDTLVNVMLTPSVQILPIVGSFIVQRGIDTSPITVVDPLCTADGQVVLTPIDGAAAAIPFWAIAGDGLFDVHWSEDPNAYTAVNADGTSVAATTTPTQIDLVEDEGSLNFDFDDVANTITTQLSGLYDFRLSMNGTATRNITYVFRVRINGTQVGEPVEFIMSGNIDDFSFSDNGFFMLTAGDIIDFTVETASGIGTINFNQFTITLLKTGTTTPEWVSAGFKYLVVQ